MANRKILMVSQYFDPEVFRGNDVAYYLASRGLDVTVVTGTPNYPIGKFYEGYGWFKKTREIKNGVRIIRIPIIARGKNALMLMLNYFSYFINTSIFLLFHLICHKYDVCFVQQLSPVMMAMPGVLFKKLTKKPLYTWVLDLWPESLQSAGDINNKYVLNFFELFVSSEYKNSDKILISSKGFEKSILEKGDYKDKLIYYPQWAEDVFSNPVKKEIPDITEGFNVMFAGNVGEAQDFTHIIEAVKLLTPEDGIRFVIVGNGRKFAWVEEQVKMFALEDRISLLGRFPIDYMPSFFEKADVMLVSLKDETIFNLTAPAKIQAYMTVAKPIVAMMNGAGYEMIKEAECGMAVPAESPEALVEALKQLKAMTCEERTKLGINGKHYCEENFDKEICLNRLFKLLESGCI